MCGSVPAIQRAEPLSRPLRMSPSNQVDRMDLSRPCSWCLPSFCFISNRSVEVKYVPPVDYHNVACILDTLSGTKYQCFVSSHYYFFQAQEFDSRQDASSSLRHHFQTGSRIRPSSYPTSLLLDVKRPGTKSGCVASYHAEIKNT
jgi:hypothetical protein